MQRAMRKALESSCIHPTATASDREFVRKSPLSTSWCCRGVAPLLARRQQYPAALPLVSALRGSPPPRAPSPLVIALGRWLARPRADWPPGGLLSSPPPAPPP